MDYNILWFVLITVLFTGFFFLEGFDYGFSTLLSFTSDKVSACLCYPLQYVLHRALPHAGRAHPAGGRV